MLADTKTAKTLNVLRGVESMVSGGTASYGKRPKTLAEAQPAGTYTELIGALTDGECALLLEHTHTS